MRAAFLMALLFSGVASAATFTSFDYPGAKTTCASGIASNGAIIGLATDGTVTSAKAFIYINGRFSVPGPKVPAGTVLFSGINAWLDLVGTDFETGQISATPFLYAQGKTSTPMVGGAAPVSLNGITDSGTLLGTITVKSSSSPFGTSTVAFTQTSGGKTQVLNDGSFQMNPLGIDPTGTRVTGVSFTSSGLTAWAYSGGVFTPLSVPAATAGTWPYAINSRGIVHGLYLTGTESASVVHGFIYEDGAYRTYDVPGATGTSIEAANEAGQFAGCYTDQSGTHGFYVTP